MNTNVCILIPYVLSYYDTQGLDVNVRFRNIDDFEFTQECAIFDLLDIQLVHGWLVSPEVNNSSLVT